MNSFKSFVVCFLMSLVAMPICAQQMQYWSFNKIDSTSLSKIDYNKNTLENPNSLYPLLAKLYRIKHFSSENAVFVHIGDSHIQADIETGIIRNELQKYYGNAGRGLVFPYQVAKTNAPYDIFSSSKSNWKNNRVARIDTLIRCGVSAFGIESQSINPDFNLELRPINGYKDYFDKVDVYIGGKVSEILLEYNDSLAENTCYPISPEFAQFRLKSNTSGFRLTFPTTDTIQFYGASLEKSTMGGIIYHSIGANGAKYSDFNKTARFWKQLDKLKADCYIVSLGTNEAQDPNLTSEAFLVDVKIMVKKLQQVSPNACIVLTTPPVSYFKKHHPNQSLEVITNALIEYCNQNNIVYWDLFNTSKGLEGAKIWKSTQYLRSDLVHFSREGYILQGNLFVDAFVKTWNDFLCKYY